VRAARICYAAVESEAIATTTMFELCRFLSILRFSLILLSSLMIFYFLSFRLE